MPGNRGYKGNVDFRYSPTKGKTSIKTKYQDIEKGAGRSSENTGQEYTIQADDWIRLGVSASNEAGSGSVLYNWTGDGSAGWTSAGQCSVRIKRNEFAANGEDGEYIGFTWRVPHKDNVWMMCVRPKTSALGFHTNGINEVLGYGSMCWGWYQNNTALTVWTASSVYTFTWDAGD